MKKIFSLIPILCITVTCSAQLTYNNPILSGFYPDPSICRVGSDYYIVNSSFAYFPGLPIFHSKDLVNWNQIGHAMDRPEQLGLEGAGVSRGLFAPTIRYHKGTYYIICTLIDKGGNFVITAKDPKGPWSNPVWLKEVNGIDPSLYFDDNDKAYVLFNSIPPNNISLHNGHRTIRMFEFDAADLKVTGEEKLLVNGGTDMAKKPVWIEGPHVFKKDGWYYLICAEGGTGYNHSEVVFRSKAVDGPYISYEKNPILTQRHLDTARKNPVTSTGHADFVETPDGKWVAVFLGCRPYEADHYNIGRETFMAPVKWEDGWPHILEGNEEVKYRYPVPIPSLTQKVNNPFSGNAHFNTEFNEETLDARFIFLRTVTEPWYSLTERKGWLNIRLRKETCSGKENPSFVAFRQQNHHSTAITSLDFNAKAGNEKAGIVIFQNEIHFYYLCKSVKNGKPVVELYQSTKDSSITLIARRDIDAKLKELSLKIESRDSAYFFYFSQDAKKWQSMTKDGSEAKFLSTKTAGGFVGAVYALYATSLGKESDNKAGYNRFTYKGNDEIFR